MYRVLPIMILFGLLAMHAGTLHGADAADEPSELDREIANLKAADGAWRRNHTAFREVRESGEASESEVREFAVFVAGLKRRVIVLYESVHRMGGDGRAHGVDPHIVEQVRVAKGAAGIEEEQQGAMGQLLRGEPVDDLEQNPGKTDKATELKAKLRQIEAEVDDMVRPKHPDLKEQPSGGPSDRDRTPGNPSDGAGAGDAKGGTSDEGDAGAPGKGANTTTRGDRQGAATGGHGATAHGAPSTKGNTNDKGDDFDPGGGPGVKKPGDRPESPPKANPDYSDDDVIARQLREAAEAETNPEMKEALWQEYRDYKAGKR